MVTALFTHASSLDHVTPPGHPERVARYEAVTEALSAARFDALDRRKAPVGDRAEILRCHPEDYIAGIEAAIPAKGIRSLDPDTHVSAGSLEPALRGLGGVCAAVDAVLAGEVGNTFVAMRPPGHHAETATAMGFCIFGSVAIAAKHALDHHGLSRVAIVDFDVHHGNGTQDLLWDEARTLVITSQQMPLFPGTGTPAETGAHGNVLNLPLAPGSTGADMRAAYTGQAFPRLRSFRPELILVSAGFDAHSADPLANLEWETEDFRWITAELCALAAELCDGRIVSCLEGGYDLQALSASGKAHVEELMKAAG